MDGDKNLSTLMVLKFAKGLELDDNETAYFEALVLHNQATEVLEKNYYADKLRAFTPELKSRTFRISGKTTLFDRPLMPALIVALAGAPVNGIEKTIQKLLPMSRDEATQAIQNLESEGILTQQNGLFAVNFDHAIFNKNPSDIKLKAYLRDQLSLSVKAFNKTYNKGGKNFSHSMGISKSQFPKLVQQLKESISEINSQYNCEPAEEVVQINIQAFIYSDIMD